MNKRGMTAYKPKEIGTFTSSDFCAGISVGVANAPFAELHLPAVPTVKGIQRFRFRRCYGAVKWGFGLPKCCESLYPACFQGILRCCIGVAEIFHKKSRKFIAKTLDIFSNLWYVVVATKNTNKGEK